MGLWLPPLTQTGPAINVSLIVADGSVLIGLGAYLPNVGVVVLGMPFTFQRILRAIVYINVTPRFRIRVIGYLDAWTTFQAIAFRVFAVKSEDVGAMSKLA
ncbi:MAG TPA: hypothetical protein DCK99_15540 [Blastocatellia bacterium]|jgi:hypothetical protein|nr:hypothetical protein [Blastocatellia bacterium]